MRKLWALVPPQVKFWLMVALFVAFIASYAYTFYAGVRWQRDRQEVKTIEKTVTIREKQKGS